MNSAGLLHHCSCCCSLLHVLLLLLCWWLDGVELANGLDWAKAERNKKETGGALEKGRRDEDVT